MAFQVIPSIDLRNGKVVRLQQGDFTRQLDYALDPVQTVQAFAAAGAQFVHLVDLDGAKAGRPAQTEAIAQLASATSMTVQVGGGVRTTDDVLRLMDCGVHRVVIGTAAIEHWDWFAELVSRPTMKDRLILALDAREGKVATRGWMHTSELLAVDVAKNVTDWPLAGILYTDVAKDGMLSGPNLHHTRLLAEAGKVPVIASGGVGHIDHIRQLLKLPVFGVIVGRSLHEGKLDLARAIKLATGAITQ